MGRVDGGLRSKQSREGSTVTNELFAIADDHHAVRAAIREIAEG